MKLFNSIKKEDQKIIKAILFLFGFEPVNINLYKLALLHKSKNKNESNERLEYLGDAVLNLIVAEYLFKKYPFKDEGFLTKIRSKIVSRESLNNLGRKVGLKELINFKNVNEYSKNYNSICFWSVFFFDATSENGKRIGLICFHLLEALINFFGISNTT